jgi:hypothetical protein
MVKDIHETSNRLAKQLRYRVGAIPHSHMLLMEYVGTQYQKLQRQ